MPALTFPLNPNTNDTFTSGVNTWVYTGNSWEAQGTSGTGGGANLDPLTGGATGQILLKASDNDLDFYFDDFILPDINFTRRCELNFNGDYVLNDNGLTVVQQAEYITGNDWLYSPSAKYLQRNKGSIFRRNTPGVYVLSGISHSNVFYQGSQRFKIGITFGIYQGFDNPTHTLFVGTSYDPWGSSNNYLSNIASANASQLGFGYNENNANWQLCVPKFIYPAGLVDLGVPKPSNNDSYNFTMRITYQNYAVLELYNLDTNTMIFTEVVNLNANPTEEFPFGREGYLPDYQRQVFHCYMSPGSTTSAQASLQIMRTYYELNEKYS